MSGVASPPSHRYLWGPAVDQILADEQVATGSPNDVRWPMTDWQGTVRDVATYNASTNVTTIANHKVYEAFGKVYSESAPTVDTIFGYTGRYFDDDAGLQWNLNRWYDPGVGRWLSEDPIGFAAGDPNLYRYVGNSVGAYTDPLGLDKVVEGPVMNYGPLNVRHLYEEDGTWIGMQDETGVVFRPGRGVDTSTAYSDPWLWMQRLSNQSYITSRAEVDNALRWRNPSNWDQWFKDNHDAELEYGAGKRKEVLMGVLGDPDTGMKCGAVRNPEQFASGWDECMYETQKGIRDVGIAYAAAPLGATGSRSGAPSSYCSNTAAQLQAEKRAARAARSGARSAMQAQNLARQLTSQEQLAEAFAGKGEAVFGAGTRRTLLDAQRLSQQYGGVPADWAKMRGLSSEVHGIRTPAGNNFEVHWYQNVKTGAVVEFKTKILGH